MNIIINVVATAHIRATRVAIKREKQKEKLDQSSNQEAQLSELELKYNQGQNPRLFEVKCC